MRRALFKIDPGYRLGGRFLTPISFDPLCVKYSLKETLPFYAFHR